MLTYIIPTYNRPEFLERLLHFYAQIKCDKPILIADSSEPVARAKNREAVARYQSRIDVDLQHFNMGVIPKCRTILEQVRTPYAVFSADDDFLVPDAITNCCQFLSNNPSYTTCGGTALFAHADHDGSIAARTYRSIESDSPVNRLKSVALGKYFCLFYAVHSTEHLTKRFQTTDRYTNYESSRILPEIMLLQLMALDGKIKMLGETAYIRQGHGDNDSCRLPNVQNPEVFQADYKQFQTPLLHWLQPELTAASARKLIQQSLIDLAPDCRTLLKNPVSSLPKWARRIDCRIRKLTTFGFRSSGSKYRISVAEAGSSNPVIQLALDLISTDKLSVEDVAA